MQYDIIGDVHGYADELEKLLQKLGYKKIEGVYMHENNRQAVFLGDIIDRGPKIREALHIVKNMCDNRSAYTIMGNHEYNAVCYHTINSKTGDFYRSRNKIQRDRHYKTINQFENYPDELKMFLDWMKHLPLFMEFENFRIIHALWDEKHINWMKLHYTCLTCDFLELSNTEGTIEYKVITDCLKGIETCLPNESSFTDIHGISRHECRIKWWQPIAKRKMLKDMLMHCPDKFCQIPFDNNGTLFYQSEIPVFFGHYWLEGEPLIENPCAICLDYSVANGGKLIAYKSEYLNSGNISDGFVY